MESLELIDFVWEQSVHRIRQCIFLPSLKHLKVTGTGTNDFLGAMAESLQGESRRLQLACWSLDITNPLIKTFEV